MALVVVDAENVRRSQWPNLSRDELVRRTREWAEREGHELLLVFEGARSADDEIVARAPGFDRPWWLVTSDRGLRERVRGAPERILGGGAFVRSI